MNYMRNILAVTMSAGLLFMTGSAFAQGKKSFDAASVKVAAPLDMAKLTAAAQRGEMPDIGVHAGPGSIDIKYTSLKELIAYAYKLKPYQITCPDWMSSQRFDILAKYPSGATKADVPEMLKSLLAERFKLVAHMESKEQPVLGLVVAKGGPKLVEAQGTPVAIDESKELAAGEQQQDTPDGPVRMKMDMKTGGGTLDMGTKGKVTFGLNQATMSLKMDADQITMGGFVEMVTQFSQMLGGSTKTVVDMTNLKGNYKIALDFPLAEILKMAQAAGMDISAANVPGAPGAGAASEPGSGSLFESIAALGLKMENRKAVIDQLVVDKAEKTPTEN